MAESAWSIRRSKRKTPSTSSSARKRVRIADDVDISPATSSSSKKRRPQSTLTQIQFVTTPQASFESNDELLESSTRNDGRDIASKSGRQKRKRDSTLTQMDWLSRPLQDDVQIDEEMLPQTQMSEAPGSQIPQVDGTNYELRTPVKRKTIGRYMAPQNGTLSAERSSQATIKKASQSSSKAINASSSRRRSGRLASRENKVSKSGEAVLATMAPIHQKQDAVAETSSRAPIPKLEVADTFDMGDTQSGLWRDHPSVPQTPTRRVVPSSQSPESMRTLTKSVSRLQQLRSPSKTARTPLAERSVNITPTRRDGRKLKPQKQSPKKSPTRRTCTLKAPSRTLLSRTTQVEDSQDDIYSIQPSSPVRQKSRTPASSRTKTTFQQQKSIESLEIPATSSSHDDSDADMQSSPPSYGIDTQYSLPAVSDLMQARRKAGEAELGSRVSPQSKGEKSSSSGDLQSHRAATAVAVLEPPSEGEMLLDREMQAADGTDVQDANDVDSDFGSPVANDTQFNRALLKRISSPVTRSPQQASPSQGEDYTHTKSKPGEQTVRDGNDSSELSSSLPTPELVSRSSPTNIAPEADPDGTPTQPASPPTFGRRSDTGGSMRQIPLNDDAPSSSPSMLPPPLPNATQRGIHPASMLRPSQMSTQEPTQGFFPSSITGHTQFEQGSNRSDVDKIVTIKDSSPTQRRLSQFPAHTSQEVKKEVIEDSDEDNDDLDLDPTSGPRHNSARKPIARLLSKTESSLKSIHPSYLDTNTNKSNQDHVLSSSPLLQAQDAAENQEETENPGADSLRRAPIARLNSPRMSTAKTASSHQRRDSLDQILNELSSSSPSSSAPSPTIPGTHTALPGFDNETQSDFTQGGHVSAAYIHRMRDDGLLPDWFTPKPYQVKRRTRKGVEVDDDDDL